MIISFFFVVVSSLLCAMYRSVIVTFIIVHSANLFVDLFAPFRKNSYIEYFPDTCKYLYIRSFPFDYRYRRVTAEMFLFSFTLCDIDCVRHKQQKSSCPFKLAAKMLKPVRSIGTAFRVLLLRYSYTTRWLRTTDVHKCEWKYCLIDSEWQYSEE